MDFVVMSNFIPIAPFELVVDLLILLFLTPIPLAKLPIRLLSPNIIPNILIFFLTNISIKISFLNTK